MKKNSLRLPVLLSTLILTGCAIKTGHTFLEKMPESEISAKLIKNKTTKSEVKNIFGDPEDVDLREDGKEIWIYKFIRSEAKGTNFIPYVNLAYNGTNDNIKKLKIQFNESGTVDKFVFSSSKGETKTSLFQ